KRNDPAEYAFIHKSPSGDIKYIKSFPKVKVPKNAEVTYIMPFIGHAGSGFQINQSNMAMVKHEDKTLIMQFPLWAKKDGEAATSIERDAPQPVKKTPPPRELTSNEPETSTTSTT